MKFKKKNIDIYFTGGTIAMGHDKNINATVPKMRGEEILKNAPNINELANINVVNFSNLPGPHMTPDKMLELSKKIKQSFCSRDVDGVIVTHGTDTLEETAYFLEVTSDIDKPIILTGSMQNISELNWDGPSNLYASIVTAISDQASGKGVLVVFNSEIHAASEVVKTHTSALNTFQSPNFGPLGIVDNDKAIFYRAALHREYIECDNVEEKVGLIQCAVGMKSDIINFYINEGIKGLVIEGMGRGNVPPMMVEGIRNAISKKIPVIIVSRCLKGTTRGSYGYPGGGRTLSDLGAILGGYLPGYKARIKLMIALGANKDLREINNIFKN